MSNNKNGVAVMFVELISKGKLVRIDNVELMVAWSEGGSPMAEVDDKEEVILYRDHCQKVTEE